MVAHHDRLRICEDRVIPMWMRRKRHEFLSLDVTMAYDESEFSETDIQPTPSPAAIQQTPEPPNNPNSPVPGISVLDEVDQVTKPRRQATLVFHEKGKISKVVHLPKPPPQNISENPRNTVLEDTLPYPILDDTEGEDVRPLKTTRRGRPTTRPARYLD